MLKYAKNQSNIMLNIHKIKTRKRVPGMCEYFNSQTCFFNVNYANN